METQDAIRQRRSIKHFDPGHRMSDAEIRRLFELAVLSPTSFNIQNWRFIAVADPDRKAALQAASWNQAQVGDASLVVMICADLQAWGREPERYWRDAPEKVREMLVPMIPGFYKDNPQLQRDEAMRSVGIAAQTLMLAARDMGYDSCPMIGFDPAKAADIIRLPKDHVIGLMVTIGKATRPANPRAGQLPLDEVVFAEHFPIA